MVSRMESVVEEAAPSENGHYALDQPDKYLLLARAKMDSIKAAEPRRRPPLKTERKRSVFQRLRNTWSTIAPMVASGPSDGAILTREQVCLAECD